jgi:RNA polymerase sigma-70 factor (ECF subfamily)
MNSKPAASARWFEEEVQIHAATLRAWVRGKYPVLADPDNIVQESLTRVWRAGQDSAIRSPKALLYTTARNLALDEMRRRQVVRIETMAGISELPVIEEALPIGEGVAQREEVLLLTEAIQSLPPRCRQVLTLRKLGLSQREIAARLGISEHAAESQISHGVRALAKYLARLGLP